MKPIHPYSVSVNSRNKYQGLSFSRETEKEGITFQEKENHKPQQNPDIEGPKQNNLKHFTKKKFGHKSSQTEF